jgi:hypothetical protein
VCYLSSVMNRRGRFHDTCYLPPRTCLLSLHIGKRHLPYGLMLVRVGDSEEVKDNTVLQCLLEYEYPFHETWVVYLSSDHGALKSNSEIYTNQLLPLL